jgi:hypothetical protein
MQTGNGASRTKAQDFCQWRTVSAEHWRDVFKLSGLFLEQNFRPEIANNRAQTPAQAQAS